MNVKRSIQQIFRGWIPKDPVLVNRTIIVFIVVLAALIIPIYYLVLESRALFGASWLIVYVVALIVLRYIVHKTGYPKPLQGINRAQILAHRIRIMIASGLFTAFAIGTASRLIIGPLPAYFWIPFVILIVVGAFIGDSLRKALQKHDLGGGSK